MTRLDAWVKLTRARSISSVTVRCKTWESTEAYARMNHILDSIGNQGGKLPTDRGHGERQSRGVARALYEHGVRIPRDVSLVGFDDMPAMDNMIPPLTTIRPDFEALGVAAMRQVLHLLGEGDEVALPASAHGVGLLPAEVVKRSSLGPAANR